MSFLRCIAGAMVLMLGACSSLPSFPPLPGFGVSGDPGDGMVAGKTSEIDAPLSASATPREQLNRAVLLLGVGRVGEARTLLAQVLAKSPNDKSALGLMEQVDGDPLTLLGRDHQIHIVVAGDTMSALAARHLGDPLKFYVLSRYNGLASPNALQIGASLKIPTGSGARFASAAVSSSTANAALPADAAKASTIRLQGLEALNKGEINLAIDLLRRAEALHRDDAAIQRDLQRALRIQSSLIND